jgi:glyoxylase-like metal-dependent hydrolase (beta-lactamase superfamily II)
MAFDRVDVGHIQILALMDGEEELGAITAEAFPDAPAEELMAYRDRYPGVYGPHDGWQLRIRAWLIRHPGGVILVDTGIGQVGAPGVEWFGRGGHLHDVLHETGTPPDAIDTVVISHVHDDHIGGLVLFEPGSDGEPVPVPAFPNSRHLLQRADWDWQHREAKENDEDAQILNTLLTPLGEAGLVDLIEGDVDLSDGISVHQAPGHTPGHQVVRLASEGLRAIVSADAFNHPAQFSHPDWPSGPDAAPVQAAATRRAVIAEVLSHPGTVVAPTHFTESFGRVKSGPDGLSAWVPL